MSSIVPPPLSNNIGNSKTMPEYKKSSGKPPRSKKEAPSRSARQVKDGAVLTGNDVTHVVRVTVLGLAGITADRSKCRSSRAKGEGANPAKPSRMRAVVAFSRNSIIRGTTSLSKKLTRSPSEDVVLADESVAARSGDDTATHTTNCSGTSQKRRHVAVWASDDNLTLGSTVTFEANLHRSDNDSGNNNTAASSAFAPKSFELTIALTEDDNRGQMAVALPLGVASLAISGDEASNGKSVIVDLPVLSLSQARPLGTSEAIGEYPLITLAPREKAAKVTDTLRDGVSKKRTGLQRLFSKKDKNGGITNFPSIAERDAFASAYSMDSSGDAILRVSLEVFEKESVGACILETAAPIKAKKTSSKSPKVKQSKHTVDGTDDPAKVSTTEGQLSDIQELGGKESYGSDEGTEFTDESEFSDNSSDFTGTIVTDEDETITLDDSVVTTGDDLIAFFSWVNRPRRRNGDEPGERDGHGVGGEPLSIHLKDDTGLVSMKVFGHQMNFPVCGASTVGDTHTAQEDLTHVTADFFGKSYQIPVPAGIAKKDDEDDETVSTFSEQYGILGSKIANALNLAFCQHSRMQSKNLNLAFTFSTLSEKDAVQIASSQRNVSSNSEQNYDEGETLATNEAKMPALPDEPSEVDDIMRIVRSKPNGNSPKERLRHKEGISPSKKQHVSMTDVSPKGVTDFEAAGKVEDEAPIPRAKVASGLAALFECGHPHSHSLGPRYEPFEPQIPPVIIQSDFDVLSVGELTATTHEQNIAAQAQLLEKALKMLHEKAHAGKRETRMQSMAPFPLSCGGDVFCSPGLRQSTTSSPIKVSSKESSSILEGTQSHPSRSAMKLDDETTFSPIEVEKVSSFEKGSSFSRVRDASTEKPKVECPPNMPGQSFYSESLPVYASMNGDGSESLVGAFTASNDENERFNPITGFEVDQVIL